MLHKWYEKIHSGLDWLNASMIVSVWELYISVEQQPTFLRQLREIFVLSWPTPEDFRRFSEDFRTLPKVSEDIRRPLSTSEAS